MVGTRHSFRCTFEVSFNIPTLTYIWSVSTRGDNYKRLTSVDIDKAELEEMGFNIAENVLTVPANKETNGTSVQCKVQGLSDFSNSAHLMVLGKCIQVANCSSWFFFARA